MVLWLVGCAPATGAAHGSGATDCATCHADEYSAWRASAHATSGSSPVLVAMLPEVERAWGAPARRACETCHSPGHGADPGVTCVSCHAAVGNERESDGRLIVDLDAPLAGPSGAPNDAHATRPGAFLASPSLCGTCHEVHGPGLFEEPTLTELHASGLEAIGTTCATCHLPELDDGRRSHRFVGFDPPWDGTDRERADAAERTRALLASALVLLVTTTGDRATVTLENAGAGHTAPTGVSFLRDLWVDVVVTTAGGETTTHPRVVALGDVPTRDGQPAALPTSADAVEPHRLALGEVATATLALPPDAVRVDAVLRARAIRESALDALGLAHLDVPTHDVATATAAR